MLELFLVPVVDFSPVYFPQNRKIPSTVYHLAGGQMHGWTDTEYCALATGEYFKGICSKLNSQFSNLDSNADCKVTPRIKNMRHNKIHHSRQ